MATSQARVRTDPEATPTVGSHPAPTSAAVLQEHDRGLAERVRLGDKAALVELYDRHASMAMATALRIVGDVSAAEEAVLDAFVCAWTGIDQFHAGEGNVRAWLLAIVRDRASAMRSR